MKIDNSNPKKPSGIQAFFEQFLPKSKPQSNGVKEQNIRRAMRRTPDCGRSGNFFFSKKKNNGKLWLLLALTAAAWLINSQEWLAEKFSQK